jgi:hypothetical protein
MKRWMIRTIKVAALAVFTLGAIGCMMHGMMMQDVEVPAASEFGMGPRRSAGGQYQATLIPEQDLQLRKLQAVRLAVADSAGNPVDGATIAIDGGMPQHGHGLPTQPRVSRALGGGEYLVEGLRFNMGGWWVLTFRVAGAPGQDSVTFNLDL